MTNRPATAHAIEPEATHTRDAKPEPGVAAEPDLADAIDGAATALAGIADALEHRTAAFPDPMLELLAESAAHAESLLATRPDE